MVIGLTAITTPTRSYCFALYSETVDTDLLLFDRNGSYYYSNPDGSTYYNNGNGYSQYNPPSGRN